LLSAESELHELSLAFISNKAEGVYAPAIHVPVGANSAVTTHSPKQSVHRGRLLTEEIPRAVMSSSSLRDLIVWPWLDRVDQVRELNGILDEEDRDVITDNV
jgi:hypothetical protein